MDTRQCSIPFTTLRAAPYSLSYGNLVQARVRAKNFIGFGAFSQENIVGAAVQTEPAQITSLSVNNALSSIESIGLTWDALLTND